MPTEIGAVSAANSYVERTEAVNRNIRRLASGSRLAIPSDDAAGVAVSGNLDAVNRRLSAVSDSISSVVSFGQTADGFLSTVQSQVTRLSELAQRATDGTLSAEGRAAIQTEFDTIRNAIGTVTNNANFNGNPIFTNSTVTTSIDSSGNTASLNLETTGRPSTLGSSGLAALDVSTTSGAINAIRELNTAIGQVTGRRAEVNADISAFNFYNLNARTENVNVQDANSRIRDLNFAQESTSRVRNSILERSSVSVLAQANRAQESSLTLLTR